MKTLLLLLLSSALVPGASGTASARAKILKGAAADRFIANYLPGADIPGPVKGVIKCNVPAMGARSDGAVSTCAIRLR